VPTPNQTVFDFDQVTCAIGPILVDGFMEGSTLSIEQEEETFTHVVGNDGRVCRSKTLNRVAKCTLTLMQVSAANDKLATLHALDRDAPNGAGIVPFFVRDRSGRTLVTGAQCWISKAADVIFDRVCVGRTWEITIARAEMFAGGN
jgi:hypothetical protein